MPTPTLKRINTFGISYIEGQLKAEHYVTIIEKILKVREEEVYGIAERFNKFLLKVTTEEKYQDICDNHLGEYTLSPGVVIEVNDISCYKPRVSVKDVPFEITSEILKQMFSCYGSVDKVKMQYNYKLKGSKYEKTKTDRSIMWMDIDKPIPSSLYIKQTQTYIYIQYENQIRTCNKCGLIGHQIRDCRTKEDDKVNIFDLDCLVCDEYDIGDLESDTSEEHTEGTVENLDQISFDCAECDYKCHGKDILEDHMKTHNSNLNAEIYMDPTQELKYYACEICDYKCNYENILIVHMETHTEEKPFACPKCENKYKVKEELVSHMVTHTEEKQLKCNKCENRFSSEVELNLHIQNHTEETLIDVSFAEIVQSPNKVAKSTPRRGSFDKSAISVSQPCNSIVEESSRKTKRGSSLSPNDYFKKTASVNLVKKARGLKKPSHGSNK